MIESKSVGTIWLSQIQEFHGSGSNKFFTMRPNFPLSCMFGYTRELTLPWFGLGFEMEFTALP